MTSKNPRTGWGVTLVSEQFAPDVGSTAQLLADLANQFLLNGAEVRVCTMKPGYVTDAPPAPWRENRGGARIRRLPRLPFARTNRKGEALNWVWGTFCLALLALFSPRRLPLLIGTNPPLAHWIGAIMKALKGQRFISLFYDLHPELSCAVGVLRSGNVVDRTWRRINTWTLRHADVAICLGDHMERAVKNRYAEANAVVIHNWCDPDLVHTMPKTESRFGREHDLLDKFVVMFSGNMGWRQRLEILLEVAAAVRDEPFRFIFIGEGAKKEKLKEIARQRNLHNVLFFPYQPRELMEHSLAAADVVVASQEREVIGFGVPCKTYTYMASGRAILGLASRPCELIDLVNAAKCGWVFDEDHDQEAIVSLLGELRRHPERCAEAGRNARKYFEKNFTLQIVAQQYAAIIRQQCEAGPAPHVFSRLLSWITGRRRLQVKNEPSRELATQKSA